MARYLTPIDIGNRALQHCRMERIVSFTDASTNAREIGFAYDKVRQSELERNLWRFATKRVVLRPIDTVTAVLATDAQFLVGALTLTFASTSGVVVGQLVSGTNIAAGSTVVSFVANTSVLLSIAITGTVASGAAITFGPLTSTWTPPAYSAATSYLVGQVVTYDNEWWQSKVTSNLANTPDVGAYWGRYTGPDTMQTWNDDTNYRPGELALASSGAVYMSLIAGGNEAHDPVTTTGFWRIVNGTATGLSILYPIGAGPWSDGSTDNVFRLPRGYLRQAPTDPKGGGFGWLGAPRGRAHEDWVIESGYIVSSQTEALFMRYVADHIDVPDWPAMFCEMLAARLAEEVAPQIAPPEALQIILANTRRHYNQERRGASGVNGIETGPVDSELDSYLTCRL
jgi:hypothetical protein